MATVVEKQAFMTSTEASKLSDKAAAWVELWKIKHGDCEFHIYPQKVGIHVKMDDPSHFEPLQKFTEFAEIEGRLVCGSEVWPWEPRPMVGNFQLLQVAEGYPLPIIGSRELLNHVVWP